MFLVYDAVRRQILKYVFTSKLVKYVSTLTSKTFPMEVLLPFHHLQRTHAFLCRL